jgi:RNA polymerase sigma-70 factor, ECF subfamily
VAEGLQDLFDNSGAADFGIVYHEFTRILVQASAAYLSLDAAEPERLAFYRSLKIRDLVLARACLAGNEDAWERLVGDYRHKVFLISCGIAKNEGAARELADSLFAELFGLRERRDGNRFSKLAYYTGRASLECWLRAVIAQEHVNRFRRERKFIALECAEPHFQASQRKTAEPVLNDALDAALGELSAERRFLLAAHYLDERSLAELGRILMLHETTVGRRLDKTLKTVRKRTLHHLRRLGLSMKAAEEALDCDMRELTIDVRSRLLSAREA